MRPRVGKKLSHRKTTQEDQVVSRSPRLEPDFFPLYQGLSTNSNCFSKGFWQCPETFLDVTTGALIKTTSGKRLEMLLNILNTEDNLTTKKYPAPNVNSTQVGNP